MSRFMKPSFFLNKPCGSNQRIRMDLSKASQVAVGHLAGKTGQIYRKTIGKPQENPQENGGLMGFNGIYPLVMTNIAIENGPVEIVYFPIENGDFPQFFVCLPEGTCNDNDNDSDNDYSNITIIITIMILIMIVIMVMIVIMIMIVIMTIIITVMMMMRMLMRVI